MTKAKLTGAMLATAVALIFAGNAVHAADSTDSSAAASQVKCVGGNACKGQSLCQSAESSCKGAERLQGQGLRDDADGQGMRRGRRQTGDSYKERLGAIAR